MLLERNLFIGVQKKTEAFSGSMFWGLGKKVNNEIGRAHV